MRLTGGQVFDLQKGFVKRDICLDGGVISTASADGKTYDATGCYVIPGLTEVHFHGCQGADFSDGDPAGLRTMADYELSCGVTQICPTGMTLPEEQLTKICEVAAEHNKSAHTGADVVGVNLEGPFLSYAKKGAQNGDWLHAPDSDMLKRLIDASEGLVKLVSVAPEEPGALEFIKQASQWAAVSVGHTAADYDTALEAFSLGARQATHLFNAMPPFTHRSPGVVGAAADSPGVKVELICDGVHIHPAVIRSVFRLFGPDRVILISDSLRCTGMPDGVYPFGGQEIELHGNRCTMLGHPETLAGSVTDLMGCLRNAAEFGIPLRDAVKAAAVNPAKAIGVFDTYGSLEPGKAASLAVLDENLNLKDVFFHGEQM